MIFFESDDNIYFQMCCYLISFIKLFVNETWFTSRLLTDIVHINKYEIQARIQEIVGEKLPYKLTFNNLNKTSLLN